VTTLAVVNQNGADFPFKKRIVHGLAVRVAKGDKAQAGN
jgi:hypothetical protein